MNLWDQLSQIGKNLAGLGQGRLIGLGAVGLAAIAQIIGVQPGTCERQHDGVLDNEMTSFIGGDAPKQTAERTGQ